MPRWHALIAWVALIPLLWALLHARAVQHPRYLRRAALTGYICGVLWYILNCYWIYQTMLYYGNVPPFGSAGIVVLFSAVLGLYFGAFGLGLAIVRRRFGLAWALTFAPFLWTALELAAARITSVPWDQLGYSQVDNLWMTRLAPWTGVYGISFVLVAGNALLLADWIPVKRVHASLRFALRLLVLALVWLSLSLRAPAPSPTSDYAVLLQPNIDVAQNDNWQGPQWEGSVAWLTQAAQQTCTPAFAGMPQAKMCAAGSHLSGEHASSGPRAVARGRLLVPERRSAHLNAGKNGCDIGARAFHRGHVWSR